ncbi:MAG: TM0106 family RecB-like putative nuclease [Polyangiaceae bacterium]|nr:TM0106 family RecB-like putative nuclease [Polyangiaceae bacterium]
MHRSQDHLTFAATDLSSFFECEHRSVLDLEVLDGNLTRPLQNDLERRILQQRGRDHEARVLDLYWRQGLTIASVPEELSAGLGADACSATIAAMARGADVIYQGALEHGNWVGRPDFLIRTAAPAGLKSSFGDHIYEPVDAKLAREEKARAVLQLCAYADQLSGIQGVLPLRMWLALGKREAALHELNTADYMAYFGRAKHQLEAFATREPRPAPYPEPVSYCDVCEFWQHCDARRRKDDHLSLVASSTRKQRSRLEQSGTSTLLALAKLPPDSEVRGIDRAVLASVRQQACTQYEARLSGKPRYDLRRDFDPGYGLELLPEPKPGDLFLDLEGDAFAADGGLEYLFGLLELGEPSYFDLRDAPGEPNYLRFWAKNPAEEKAAFEQIVDRIKRGREEFATMHVFHFGHRENDALKKLSCKHATREEDVDTLLREHVLIDLHTVVRQSLWASVEAYTLKELEAQHGFTRSISRRESTRAMQIYGWWLETEEAYDDLAQVRHTLEQYNKEDCLSTWRLRNWLESLRPELAELIGRPLTRPARYEPPQKKEGDDKNAETEQVARQLRNGLPPLPAEDTREQRGKRLLADLLGWHWRELKSSYWEYYAAKDEPPTEWRESRLVLDGLQYQKVVKAVKRSYVHRYEFPPQEHAVRTFPDAEIAGTEKQTVDLVAIGADYVDIKRGKDSPAGHPAALRPGRPRPSTDQERQLLEIAKSVTANGFSEETEYRAAQDLLLTRAPRCGQAPDAPLVNEGEDMTEALKRLCLNLDRSTLSIQGPPGSGKTYQATHAILALVRAGRRVGVTANSHQVITELLKKLHQLAGEQGEAIAIHHVCDPERFEENPLPFTIDKDYKKTATRLANGTVQVVGGTSFAWASAALKNSVDVLFIEEAGQLSLANALAVSPAAKSLVLLGDPAQLEQPTKGAHPPGAEISALEHILGSAVTMPAHLGVFLPETRRLHPDICAFTSRIFYEDRLKPVPGLERQRINGPGPWAGSGLRYLPVEHTGNTNRSDEEIEKIAAIVDQLFSANMTFRDSKGNERPLHVGEGKKDVLVVAPYNVQVAALKNHLPADRVEVGTVDKFQGKEAPIVIYSMTTSSGDEAPRGLEFLYSLNRFNVATSRAQGLVILVACPTLLRARCSTPRHLKLVNALCAYLERAEVVTA